MGIKRDIWKKKFVAEYEQSEEILVCGCGGGLISATA
jgi:hypothetical protein